MAHDVATELWGWDGRILLSLRTLVRHPGKLSVEFLEGRRARYLTPFRLYLIASVSYFLLAASAPDVQLDSGETLMVGLRVGVTATDSARDANDPNPGRGGQALTAEERAVLMEEIQESPAFLRPLLIKSLDDPAALRRTIFATLPKVFFVLLPFFALVTSLFYRGRQFPEHLYVAIHLHAFLFLMLALTELAKFTQLPWLVLLVALGTTISLLVYGELVFRVVYGGKWWTRLLKGAGIAAIYSVGATVAFLAMLAWISAQLA